MEDTDVEMLRTTPAGVDAEVVHTTLGGVTSTRMVFALLREKLSQVTVVDAPVDIHAKWAPC